MRRSPASLLSPKPKPTHLPPHAVLDVPAFDWVTEESRNLGTLVVTFWPRSSSSGKRAGDEYDVVAVESDSVLVSSSRGGPASRLSLPCPVVPQKATVTSAGASYEIKLVTAGLSSPTKSRADLEVHTPLSTDELRATAPASFHCATCDVELVDASPIERYNALPSEHWAELLDAWMCHQDQTLSDDLIAKGKGIKPRDNEGLVGTSYILLPQAVTRNWVMLDVEVRPQLSSFAVVLLPPSPPFPPSPSPPSAPSPSSSSLRTLKKDWLLVRHRRPPCTLGSSPLGTAARRGRSSGTPD